VLAGGRSSRMGAPKAGLEWHGSTLLHRTAALLARTVTGPVLVVRAPGQRLPALPAGVEVADDEAEGLGPMQGIAAGLAAVGDRAAAAFVCSTDLPFLHPAYVRRVLRGLDDPAVQLVVPLVRGFRQPLAAAYRPGLAALVRDRLARGSRRVSGLPDLAPAALPDEDELLADPELARLDPRLESLRNVNTPAEYAAARARPGPEVLLEWDGRTRPVVAATLTEAVAGLGRAPGRARLNGVVVRPDPLLPLVTGDVIAVELQIPVDGWGGTA
jgi:molybdopterin-guanine dinucleotide biosynthesis protein A